MPEGRQWNPARVNPAHFSLVMATGIVSVAAWQQGLHTISTFLLAVAGGAYLLLVATHAWRVASAPREALQEELAGDRLFGSFAFVAGSDVLGERLMLAGRTELGIALALAGLAAYLALTYAVPAAIMLGADDLHLGRAVDGTWLLWVVATQSVSTVAATLAHDGAQVAPLSTLAVCFWALGTILYLILIVIVMMRMLLAGLPPEHLSPPYWICMGATAITVLAGSHILLLPSSLPILETGRQAVRGMSLLLWAFGSWWIPLLVILGVHRHLVRRHPLAYEPMLWSMVFPLGMYAAAGWEFGKVEHLGFMVAIASVAVWVALVVWALVLGSLLASFARGLGAAVLARD